MLQHLEQVSISVDQRFNFWPTIFKLINERFHFILDNQDDNNLMANEKDMNQRDLIHRRRVKNRFRSGRSKKDKNSKANLAPPGKN